MEEQSELRRRMVRLGEAAGPVLIATAEMVGPMLAAMGAAFKTAGERARVACAAFTVRPAPRRRAARKPCAWCTGRFKNPATHTVKWTEGLEWELLPEQGGGVWRVPVGHQMIMCQFHADQASRYPGVKTYRFRRT